MSLQEFNNGFDILYNNIMSGAAPGINVYEKSFFLTKAQDEIVKNYFYKKNTYQAGVEETGKRNTDFTSIIKEVELTGTFTTTGRMYNNMLVYKIPDDYFIELALRLIGSSPVEQRIVKSVSSVELDRLQSKPYREPARGQAWKLHGKGEKSGSNEFEIIINKNDKSNNWRLFLRYVKYPQPIILTDLSFVESEFGLLTGSLSINGKKTESECELNQEIHQEILSRAVELAAVSFTDDKLAPMLQTDTRNE